jgi:hypothetical protein
MRQNIQEYVRRCDKCPNRRGKHEFRELLGEVEDPSEPLQVTSMDIKGPYCITPRKTPILLTFMEVVYSCFDVMQGHGCHDTQSHVSGDSYTCHGHNCNLLSVLVNT